MRLKITPYPKISTKTTNGHHANFQTLAENSPDVICRFDRELRQLYVNPAIERVTGIPTTIFMGKTPHEIGMPKPFADFWKTHVDSVFQNGKQITIEFIFPTVDGERHFQSLLVPEYDALGEIKTVLSMSRDITEIKMQERQKNDFIGMVSHELKTPLTSVKAFTQILQQRVEGKDIESAEHLEKMNAQLNRLSNLINDLLDVTKIQSGKLQFRQRLFDFNELVNEIVDSVQQTTETHTILVSGKIKRKAYGDRDRIGQVLTNLLSNAIKYSPNASKVEVSYSSDAKHLICSVKDYGVGISKATQEKIFERFFQATNGNKPSYPGLGLGLYISSEIIKRQHGKIWVESARGKGATFYFSLPLRKRKKATKK